MTAQTARPIDGQHKFWQIFAAAGRPRLAAATLLYTLPWSQVSDRQPPVDPMTAKGMIAASDYSILAFHIRGRDLQGQAIVLHAWGQHGLTHSIAYISPYSYVVPKPYTTIHGTSPTICEPGGVLDGPSAFGW